MPALSPPLRSYLMTGGILLFPHSQTPAYALQFGINFACTFIQKDSTGCRRGGNKCMREFWQPVVWLLKRGCRAQNRKSRMRPFQTWLQDVRTVTTNFLHTPRLLKDEF